MTSADFGWLKARPLADLLDALDRDGEEARVNGGAVRDALLGLPPGDIDVATTATPDKVAARAERRGWKTVPTGLAHGTVTVVIGGEPFEVTTLRRDVETDGRRAVVAFTRDWAEDAARRDLTINGLFLDRSGKVHDHVGGLADVASGRVRFIGSARARIREDYLRTLRFFRFHARFARGDVDPEGFSAAVAERRGLAGLSAERVRSEFLKLLVAARAVETVALMAGAGLFSPLVGGVPRPTRLARIAALDLAEPDALLRLAGLFQMVSEDADRLTARLRLSRREAARLDGIGDNAPALGPESGPEAAKVALYRLGPQAFRDRALLAWADRGAPADDADWARLAGLPDDWSAPKFPIAAADMLERGVVAGPGLGRALRRAEADWEAAGFPLDPGSLAAIADAAARA